MAVIEIPINNLDPAFTFAIELDGKTYNFTFRWNGRIQNWVFDLFDALIEPIQLGNPFIVNFEFLRQNQSLSQPPGVLVARNNATPFENPNRFNIGSDVKFFYIEEGTF
jgi:hypothetical protein